MRVSGFSRRKPRRPASQWKMKRSQQGPRSFTDKTAEELGVAYAPGPELSQAGLRAKIYGSGH